MTRNKVVVPFKDDDPDFGGCWVYRITDQYGELNVTCHTYYTRHNKRMKRLWFNIKVFMLKKLS